MNRLNRFERIIYYPVAIVWTFFAVSSWTSAFNSNVFSLPMWVASLGVFIIWYLPFFNRYFLLGRTVLWSGFLACCAWLFFVSPWIAAAVISLFKR